MNGSLALSKDDLCSLIPHSYGMCLIDSVSTWDAKTIICHSNSHRHEQNPLCYKQKLPASALIEYGAQAMAIHGGLLSGNNGAESRQGYIASLRNIKLSLSADISQIKSSLTIEAIQLVASDGNMIYQFSVKSDQSNLVSGRATVISIKEK